LSVSDVFIFTSLREGLPRVIVEASLLELPVVTFSVEGANEVLENNKTGFIVEQGNVNELVHSTERLILQPELRKQFGKLASRHVIEHWDKRLMSIQLREIYNRKIQ
jgi:glycosyltransferase involved in cell wall biosynthesis